MLRLRAARPSRFRYGPRRRRLHGVGRGRRWRPRRYVLQRRRGLRADWRVQRHFQGQRLHHRQPVHQADRQQLRAVRRNGKLRPHRIPRNQGRLRRRGAICGRPRRHQPGDDNHVLVDRDDSRQPNRRRAGGQKHQRRRRHRRDNRLLLPRLRSRELPPRLHGRRAGRLGRLQQRTRQRHRQLLHRRALVDRRPHRRQPRRRLGWRKRRRRSHQLLLRLANKRRRRRRRRPDHVRPANPNGLHRRHNLRQLERQRGRDDRQRRPLGLRDGVRIPRAEIRRTQRRPPARHRLRRGQRRADRDSHARAAERRPARSERRRRRRRRRRRYRLRRRLPQARRARHVPNGLPRRDMLRLRARRPSRLRYGRRRLDLHRNRRGGGERPTGRLPQRRHGLGADWHLHQQIHRHFQGQRIRHLQPVHKSDGYQQRGAVRRFGGRRPHRKRGTQERIRQRGGHGDFCRRPRRGQPGDGRRILERRRGSGKSIRRRACRLQHQRSRRRPGRDNSQLLPRLGARFRHHHRPRP